MRSTVIPIKLPARLRTNSGMHVTSLYLRMLLRIGVSCSSGRSKKGVQNEIQYSHHNFQLKSVMHHLSSGVTFQLKKKKIPNLTMRSIIIPTNHTGSAHILKFKSSLYLCHVKSESYSLLAHAAMNEYMHTYICSRKHCTTHYWSGYCLSTYN